MGYDVRRADDLHEEGLITHQVIERLVEDDLVVADLTGRNANVYYELAVRHAAQKPVAHLIEQGEHLPFDVGHVRAIAFSVSDPDLLEEARADLKKKVGAIERATRPASNPIHAALNLRTLRDSDVPEAELAGTILSEIADIRVELQSLNQRLGQPDSAGVARHSPRFSVGDEVVHAKFGEGKVVGGEPGGVVVVLFAKDESARKIVADLRPLSLVRSKVTPTYQEPGY